MVHVLQAIGGAGAHQLRRVGGLRQRHAPRPRAGQRQAQVLLVQADAETRVEGALDHAFAMHLKDAAGGKAAHQRLGDEVLVD